MTRRWHVPREHDVCSSATSSVESGEAVPLRASEREPSAGERAYSWSVSDVVNPVHAAVGERSLVNFLTAPFVPDGWGGR